MVRHEILSLPSPATLFPDLLSRDAKVLRCRRQCALARVCPDHLDFFVGEMESTLIFELSREQQEISHVHSVSLTLWRPNLPAFETGRCTLAHVVVGGTSR